MTLLACVVAGVLLGYAGGGSLGNLMRVRLWGESLLLGALVVQSVTPVILGSLGGASSWAVPIWIAAGATATMVAARNHVSPGMLAITVGGALNLLVVAVNGGMPVSAGVIVQATAHAPADAVAGIESASLHIPLGAETNLPILADIMPLPVPAFGAVVSAGDVVLCAGVAVFLVWAMTRRPDRIRVGDVP